MRRHCHCISSGTAFWWIAFLNLFSLVTKIASPNLRCTIPTLSISALQLGLLPSSLQSTQQSMILFAGNPTNVICEGFGVNNVAHNAYAIFPLISVACSESHSHSNYVQKNVPKRLDTTEELPLFSAIPSVPAWGAILLWQLFGGNNHHEILWHWCMED